MPSPSIPTCAGCGGELVLEIDPAPAAGAAGLLPADPPFRFVCPSPHCVLAATTIL